MATFRRGVTRGLKLGKFQLARPAGPAGPQAVTNALAPSEGSIVVAGEFSALTLILAPLVGALILAGNAPSITQSLAMTTGAVAVSGQTPSLLTAFVATPAALVVAGETPSVTQALQLAPTEGQVVVSGQTPALSLAILASEGAVVIDGGTPTVSVVGESDGTALSPAGRASAAVRDVRRRYIMPDGTMFYATTNEAIAMLQDFSVPVSAPHPQTQITLQKREVRFQPAEDAMPDTWKAVIPERFTYQPPPEIRRQTEIAANRMRADEEAILALIL